MITTKHRILKKFGKQIERETIERVLELIGEDNHVDEQLYVDYPVDLTELKVVVNSRNELRQELKDKLTQEFIKK